RKKTFSAARTQLMPNAIPQSSAATGISANQTSDGKCPINGARTANSASEIRRTSSPLATHFATNTDSRMGSFFNEDVDSSSDRVPRLSDWLKPTQTNRTQAR